MTNLVTERQEMKAAGLSSVAEEAQQQVDMAFQVLGCLEWPLASEKVAEQNQVEHSSLAAKTRTSDTFLADMNINKATDNNLEKIT